MNQDTSQKRKYLYLLTDHPDQELVGRVEITDSPKLCTAEKNEEGVCRKRNLDTREQYDYHLVGLGHADFEDETDYEERIGDVIEDKLAEIDSSHLEKAGVELTEVA